MLSFVATTHCRWRTNLTLLLPSLSVCAIPRGIPRGQGMLLGSDHGYLHHSFALNDHRTASCCEKVIMTKVGSSYSFGKY